MTDTLRDPEVRPNQVFVGAGDYYNDARVTDVELTPDEARLYALKLIRAADRAEERA